MNLPTEIFGEVIVVHTPEELGADQADHLEAFLTTLERSQVVLDIDATETLDSAGLTALLEVQENLRQLDGDLKIATSNEMNRKIFEITRLDQQLELFESVIDAVKSFVAKPAARLPPGYALMAHLNSAPPRLGNLLVRARFLDRGRSRRGAREHKQQSGGQEPNCWARFSSI